MAVKCKDEHIDKVIECCNNQQKCMIFLQKYFLDNPPHIYVRLSCPDKGITCEDTTTDRELVVQPLEKVLETITKGKLTARDLEFIPGADNKSETLTVSRYYN